MSEYAQTTQNNVNEHEYASDNKVIIAFVTSDWNLYDSKGRLMTVHSLDDQADLSKKMKLMFRIQKNLYNGQTINFVVDDKHPHICTVRAAYQIYQRAKSLGQLDDQPMGIFVNHQGIVRSLTANKIAEVLQSGAKNMASRFIQR